MQNNNWQILSTRPLSNELIALAASHNIIIDESCFIETKILENENIKCKIQNYLLQKSTIVFTSMNAVEAVSKYINQKPAWNIYCIGNTTKHLVEKFFGESSVSGTAENAGLLADIIIKDDVKQLQFFCGDQRRDDLPAKLKDHKIFVEEIVVYNTVETPVLLNKKYDAILFFSPSAVQSFFSINNIEEQTKIFAIGTTTAEAIELYTKNNVIISDSPGKENLVKQMINYFSNIKNDKIVL